MKPRICYVYTNFDEMRKLFHIFHIIVLIPEVLIEYLFSNDEYMNKLFHIFHMDNFCLHIFI